MSSVFHVARGQAVEIREAKEADWPAILAFFKVIVDAGHSYVYPEDLSSEQARALWMEPAPGRCFVAVEGGEIVGSAKTGPNRPGRGGHVATASFMVSPEFAGAGIGRALGEHVIEAARQAGYLAMQFNAVVESNTVAVHLWQSLGFTIIGTVPRAFDDATVGLVGLHVMHRYL